MFQHFQQGQGGDVDSFRRVNRWDVNSWLGARCHAARGSKDALNSLVCF
jgi:hypothetical protein